MNGIAGGDFDDLSHTWKAYVEAHDGSVVQPAKS